MRRVLPDVYYVEWVTMSTPHVRDIQKKLRQTKDVKHALGSIPELVCVGWCEKQKIQITGSHSKIRSKDS